MAILKVKQEENFRELGNNYSKLFDAVGNVELTEQERKTLQWLGGWEKSTVDNICSIINKTKKRNAGRKKQVNPDLIKELRSSGMTQQQVANKLNISISTVKRNE